MRNNCLVKGAGIVCGGETRTHVSTVRLWAKAASSVPSPQPGPVGKRRRHIVQSKKPPSTLLSLTGILLAPSLLCISLRTSQGGASTAQSPFSSPGSLLSCSFLQLCLFDSLAVCVYFFFKRNLELTPGPAAGLWLGGCSPHPHSRGEMKLTSPFPAMRQCGTAVGQRWFLQIDTLISSGDKSAKWGDFQFTFSIWYLQLFFFFFCQETQKGRGVIGQIP